MTKKAKDIEAKKKFRYREKNDEYVVQLKRRNWWWLLLLLLLLLFVKCHKDITVTCTDADSGMPIEGQTVTLEYDAHYLGDLWRVLPTDHISISQETDSTGTTVFRDLPCSVFSYIFYCLSEATFTATSDCYDEVEEEHNFHYTCEVDMKMSPKREDLQVRLVDLETKDPLPDAILHYKYREGDQEKTDSVQADPSGIAVIPQMRLCSVVDMLLGRCYGYADTTRTAVPCQQLLAPNDNTTLHLRPLKNRFTFYVKNVDNKDPIPGAECYVTLTHPSGRAFGPYKVTTSTDGKGIAVVEDAFMLATIAIEAQKRPHYRDSMLTGGPWVVETFKEQDADTRTIWLKPVPYMREFENVDSINGNGIPGVRNVITIKHPDGTTDTITETSNSYGKFPVTAEEDAEIEIVSTKEPDYHKKITLEKTFKDVRTKIPLSPVMVTLPFRTISATNNTPLPGCSLKVSGTISGSLQPANSGSSGVFNVTFRRGEKLSITASKRGYSSNSNKVNNQTWDYLNVSQDRRDIPLKNPLKYEYRGSRNEEKKYDMVYPNREFKFEWKVCSYCTTITLMDDANRTIGRSYGYSNYADSLGTVILRCPTRYLKVIIRNINSHDAYYSITSN